MNTLTLTCPCCSGNIELSDNIKEVICSCGQQLTLDVDAEFVDGVWRDRSKLYKKRGQMTPEEINKRIAAITGRYIPCRNCQGGWMDAACTGVQGFIRMICSVCNGSGKIGTPNYYGDLNACAEMEKTLNERERARYTHEILCRTVWTGNYPLSHTPSEQEIRWGCTHATAPQRCEAFLKVKGEWE